MSSEKPLCAIDSDGNAHCIISNVGSDYYCAIINWSGNGAFPEHANFSYSHAGDYVAIVHENNVQYNNPGLLVWLFKYFAEKIVINQQLFDGVELYNNEDDNMLRFENGTSCDSEGYLIAESAFADNYAFKTDEFSIDYPVTGLVTCDKKHVINPTESYDHEISFFDAYENMSLDVGDVLPVYNAIVLMCYGVSPDLSQPAIPPITVIDDDGNTVTIVARGEDYSESNYVTVVDTNGKRYLIRYWYDDSLLDADGDANDENYDPDALDGCITAAITNVVTPANNWRLLAWLHDYYELTLNISELFLMSGGIGKWAGNCSVECENGLQTIGGTISGRATKGVIYDDSICGPDADKYIDCQGKQTSAEPELRVALETTDLGILALSDATEDDRLYALTTLILQVNRIIDYPLKVVTP